MRRGVVAKRCCMRLLLEEGSAGVWEVRLRQFRSWGFYVDTHPRGVPRRTKTFRSGFASRDEAERELLELLKGVHGGAGGAPTKQPLERYLKPWLKTRTHLRPTTAETYGILIDRYICNPDFGIGVVPLRDLTRPLICKFYANIEQRGRIRGEGPLRPKAVHNVHLMLRKALEDAVEDSLLLTNPARRAHKLPAIHREMKTWTDEELASFLKEVGGDRLHALWRTAATTGMRRGELLSATWPGVDLAARRLHVTQALSKGPKGAPSGSARRRPTAGGGRFPSTARRPGS
jgi:hypothetical protein